MDRRRFLSSLTGSVLGVHVLGCRSTDSPVSLLDLEAVPLPFRTTGRVVSEGRGLTGVVVSDGLFTATTDDRGNFDLASPFRPETVFIRVPRGYRFPTDAGGLPMHFVRFPTDRSEFSTLFELAASPFDQSLHSMGFLGDIQVLLPEDVLNFRANAVPDLLSGLLRSRDRETMLVAGGDMIFDTPGLLGGYLEACAALGTPVLQIVGNHDRDPKQPVRLAKSHFTKAFGPRYYSFERGQVHYAVLDTIEFIEGGFRGVIDPVQFRWLAEDLSHVEVGRPVVLLGHLPLAAMQPATRQLLEATVAPFSAHYFCGHWHVIAHNGGRLKEHVSGAICGAWWSGPICADGTPCGYMIIDADGESISWRYKSVGLPDSTQMRIYSPQGAGQLRVNLWNWDPTWQVRWWQDGTPRGTLIQGEGFDALSNQLHAGPDLPTRARWVDPVPTQHMLFGGTTAGWREIRVVATDPWGRHYQEIVRQEP